MPPSTDTNPADGTRRTGRLTLVGLVVCLLAVLVALNHALIYALVPSGGMTEVIWRQYDAAADDALDTVVVGSSYSMTIDPTALDETLGSRSFNLSTPSQSRQASLVAVQDAYEDHGIKRVVMGIAVGNMSMYEHELMYDIAFHLNESAGRGLGHFLRTYASMTTGPEYWGKADSLAAMVPWAAYNVGWSPSVIRENVRNKRSRSPEELLAGNGYRTKGQGYIIQGGLIDLQTVSERAVAATPEEYEVDERIIEEYRRIATYCSEHGIELYLVVTPRPEAALIRFEEEGGYARAMGRFKEALSDTDAVFLDFSLTDPDFYRVELDEFRDIGHLNAAGAERFSSVLGDVIGRMEDGEDVTGLFLGHDDEGWARYLDAVSGIALAPFFATVGDGEIALELKSWAGTGVVTEFEVSRRLEDGSYEVLRPYNTENSFSYRTEGHGVETLRVAARVQGEQEEAVVSERTVLY